MCSTRSGCIAATACAVLAKGHCAGSEQDWKLLLDFFMRQPVSAMIAMRCGLALGSGNVREATVTFCAVDGSLASHTVTGKSEGLESAAALAVVRCGTVAGPTRWLMRLLLPSTTISGQPA